MTRDELVAKWGLDGPKDVYLGSADREPSTFCVEFLADLDALIAAAREGERDAALARVKELEAANARLVRAIEADTPGDWRNP